MRILNICNLSILLRKIVIYLVGENVIFMDFSAVKLTEVMSSRESVKRLSYGEIPAMTSVPSNLTEKVHEDDIFVRQDIL